MVKFILAAVLLSSPFVHAQELKCPWQNGSVFIRTSSPEAVGFQVNSLSGSETPIHEGLNVRATRARCPGCDTILDFEIPAELTESGKPEPIRITLGPQRGTFFARIESVEDSSLPAGRWNYIFEANLACFAIQ